MTIFLSTMRSEYNVMILNKKVEKNVSQNTDRFTYIDIINTN